MFGPLGDSFVAFGEPCFGLILQSYHLLDVESEEYGGHIEDSLEERPPGERGEVVKTIEERVGGVEETNVDDDAQHEVSLSLALSDHDAPVLRAS